MNKENRILELLKTDGLSEAEKITGESYKNDKLTEMIGFGIMMRTGEELRELLTAQDDTLSSNKTPDYLRKITDFGFVKIFEEPFIYIADYGQREEYKETHYIFFHYGLSILLSFDTFFNGTSINSGNFYYNWKPLGEKNWSYTSSGGYVFEEGKNTGIWSGNHDCREALKTNIKQLSDHGEFLKEWKDCPLHWLTNFSDHKSGGISMDFTPYYEKTKRIISTFPDEVKKAIGEYRKGK